ncbi:Uncharacterised protein [Yersinia frederiksenii]|uniref:Uncharacterized protein n=2 Tax=Yersinia frederiksenii TaxID=29484 RepID=A0A380PRH7_YERFR|nr:hypothetical protein DJ58_2417 [Yersinia frederiksenii ATCC 33641]CFQ93796.1 Uncharacterised protein [Yersinia frederiksenii]CNB59203.1 Uncharacterised protein [Yersinia frederiksenii]CNF29753.1 Uncharacterised protein [Yersinia frederiksenii]SUP76158.1 Uncharacterised protein [Yersinia frederiksenii]
MLRSLIDLEPAANNDPQPVLCKYINTLLSHTLSVQLYARYSMIISVKEEIAHHKQLQKFPPAVV